MRGGPAPVLECTTMVAALARAAQSNDGVTFVDLRERERTFTWRELQARARRAAGALRELGIREGDRVAIVLPTGPSFLDAFFGAMLAGAVPVPLYPPVRLGRMDEYHRATARMLTTSGARIVVSDGRVSLLLGTALASARPELGLHSAESLLGGTEFEAAPAPEALGLVQFSSGSTVDPKPVALTHANLVAQVAAIKLLMPAIEGLRHLGVSWLPLYHDMGLIGCLLNAAYFPGPLVLIPPEAFLARPAIWLRTLSRHRGTASAGPNFAYGLCLKRVRDEDLNGVDLSAWRYALNGAEPISAKTLRRFADRFAPYGFRDDAFFPVYGLSEAALAVTWPAQRRSPKALRVDAQWLAERGEAREGGRELVSVGAPIPGVEVELRDDDGRPLAEARVGRIFVRGPSVMTGYLNQPEETRRALLEGWLDTGDLGFIADGELFISGRAKDLVIIRGANHTPAEFEESLESVPGVRTGCAVALGFVPEGEDAEALLILVERAEDEREGLEQRVQAAIVERTGIKPHTVRVLEPGTLPRTSSGKLRRAEALRRYLAGALHPPKKVGTAGVAVEIARSMIARARTEWDL